MPLQHQQLLSLPASGVVMGLLTALPYTAALGWPMALSLGALLAVALGWLAAWLAWRSDHAARHSVANAVLFSVFLASLLGGMNLLLMHMLGKPAWAWPAWAVGALTTLVPMAFAAVHARGRLLAQGASGPWARQHIDAKRGVLRAGALAVQGEDRVRAEQARQDVDVLERHQPLAAAVGVEAGMVLDRLRDAMDGEGMERNRDSQLAPDGGQSRDALGDVDLDDPADRVRALLVEEHHERVAQHRPRRLTRGHRVSARRRAEEPRQRGGDALHGPSPRGAPAGAATMLRRGSAPEMNTSICCPG
jgi:hypothetical protein